MAVFSGSFMPLEASAVRPSLALVGFFLMVPNNDRSWPGIVKDSTRHHVRTQIIGNKIGENNV